MSELSKYESKKALVISDNSYLFIKLLFIFTSSCFSCSDDDMLLLLFKLSNFSSKSLIFFSNFWSEFKLFVSDDSFLSIDTEGIAAGIINSGSVLLSSI